MTLTDEQKKLVKSTASIMKEHGKDITTKFYNTLFTEHPEFRNFFNQTNQKTGKQPMALAQTVYYFAEHLDNLEVMTPQMARISSKHRAILVKPEHYPIVGKYLIQSIKAYLGDKATPELMAAWQALYDLIASTFINEEKKLYAKLGNDERDKGFVPFTVTKKENIASGPIVAVTLTRQDGGKLFGYQAGQYVTLRVEKDGVLHNGHYPLIDLFNGYTYSVAFKPGNDVDQNSIVSDEILHHRAVGSTILGSAPAGSFSLAHDAKHHLFISGGIGVTSFIAMIEELNQQGKAASATLVQCVRTEGHAAFAAKLHKILTQGQYVILTQEDPLSKSHLEGKLHADTHVYVAGSEVFLTMAENALAGFAHPKSQIHMRSIEPTLRILRNIDHK
jgi:nitric oxide dioxygenase